MSTTFAVAEQTEWGFETTLLYCAQMLVIDTKAGCCPGSLAALNEAAVRYQAKALFHLLIRKVQAGDSLWRDKWTSSTSHPIQVTAPSRRNRMSTTQPLNLGKNRGIQVVR